MLKISQFARFGMVSVKALRFYDELGLLRPAQIDEETGYRNYRVEQLKRLNQILALKDLGFSLEQVKSILETGLGSDQIRLLLAQKQAELELEFARIGDRLERVRVRLRQLEQEGEMPEYEVVLKRVEPIRVASVRGVIPSMDLVTPTLNRLFDEVVSHINANGEKFAGPGLDLWHEMGMKETDINVEAAIPISGELADGERVKVSTLPAVDSMACVILHGDFSGMGKAHGAVNEWIRANGYKHSGPGREVYLHYDRNGDTSQFVTEIQYPVEKA